MNKEVHLVDWEEERLLYKIAKMYYDENFTQGQIAKELDIYRTTIGRMLKKAREKGIVKIEIQSTLDKQFDLEEKIANHFGLKEVIIAPSHSGQGMLDLQSAIGSASSKLLDRIIKDEDVVGLAWGTTLGHMVNQMTELKPKNINCVPLVGGPGGMSVDFHVNAIVYKLAQAFNGHPHFIDAAAIYKSSETTKEIIDSEFMKKVIDLWDELTVAIVGIGAPFSSSNMVWSGFLGDEEKDELKQNNAIGDICSRFFTSEGKLIDSPIAERTIAIQLDKLKGLRYSIGVAHSVDKVDSIIGAIKGKYINTLLTNEETALEINRIIES